MLDWWTEFHKAHPEALLMAQWLREINEKPNRTHNDTCAAEALTGSLFALVDTHAKQVGSYPGEG